MVTDRSLIARSVLLPGLLGVVALALVEQRAWAQDEAPRGTLTIDDALAGALGRPEVEGALRAGLRAGDGLVDAESEFDNPEISYEREQLFGGTEGGSEDVVGLSKTFEISGARRLRIEAAEHRRREIEAVGVKWRLDLEQDTRQMFYRSLYRQRRVEAFERWIGSLERVVGEVDRRAAAGDVSEYDLLTLARELAFARAELVVEQAARERDWALLASRIDADAAPERPRLAGELLPTRPPATGDRLPAPSGGNPELAVLDAGIDASRARAEAAGRTWVPDVTLSTGYKTAAVADERAHGFVVGITAPLPLLSQGRGARDEAAAEHQLRIAERALVEARLSGELRGRAAQADRLYEAAVALQRDLDSARQGLPEIAETAYRGGELGVLELVDAHRGHLEALLRSLELELAAREARIELDRTTGGTGR
jgi:cobalt-zinc-cadmium efflux system outer membrane protein